MIVNAIAAQHIILKNLWRCVVAGRAAMWQNVETSVVRIRDACVDARCGDLIYVDYEKHKVYGLVDEFLEGRIVMPEFQRRYVWNDLLKSVFIESLILGLPVPPIILAEASPGSDQLVVIDGQQRMRTVVDYVTDRFPLTHTSFAEISGLRFSQLPQWARVALRNRDIPIIVVRSRGMVDRDRWVSMLMAIFARLNSHMVRLSGYQILLLSANTYFTKKLSELLRGTVNVGAKTMPIVGMRGSQQLALMEFSRSEMAYAVDAAIIATMLATAINMFPTPISDTFISRREAFTLIKRAVIDSSPGTVDSAINRVLDILAMVGRDSGVPVDYLVRPRTYFSCNPQWTGGRPSTRLAAALTYIYLRLFNEGVTRPAFSDVCHAVKTVGRGVLIGGSVASVGLDSIKRASDAAVEILLSLYKGPTRRLS